MRALAIVLASACAKPSPPCSVELTGNFTEASTTAANCPTLSLGAGATSGDTLLGFALASRTLRGTIAISLDLGMRPSPGTYNSGTTELWTASGSRQVARGSCVFRAGNTAAPTGDFVLSLAAVDPPHGTLALTLFVLPRVADDGTSTDCGPGTTEQLRATF